MNPVFLRLAADFLDEYADRLSNDGCNDWEYPDWMHKGGRLLVGRLCSEGECIYDAKRPPQNTFVARAMAAEFRRVMPPLPAEPPAPKARKR